MCKYKKNVIASPCVFTAAAQPRLYDGAWDINDHKFGFATAKFLF